jgi:hypothetical protein
VHSGPITNEDILMSGDFYRTDDPEDVCNTPLKESAKIKRDFKVITKQQWDFLYNLYGGTPIVKEMYKPAYYIFFKPDISFQKMSLAVFVAEEQFVEDESDLCAREVEIEQVKVRIRKVLNQKDYGFNLSGEFRMWHLESLESLQKFAEQVKVKLENYKRQVTPKKDIKAEVSNTSAEPMSIEDSSKNKDQPIVSESNVQDAINASSSQPQEPKDDIKKMTKPVIDCEGYRIDNTSQISTIEKLKLKNTDTIIIEVADKDGEF